VSYPSYKVRLFVVKGTSEVFLYLIDQFFMHSFPANIKSINRSGTVSNRSLLASVALKLTDMIAGKI
jgi:hypothetical protein